MIRCHRFFDIVQSVVPARSSKQLVWRNKVSADVLIYDDEDGGSNLHSEIILENGSGMRKQN